MKDISIDLETLSLSNRARILSIGACEFNRETGAIGKQFYCTLEPPIDSIGKCIETSDATAEWWDKQSSEAKAALQLNRLGYASGLNSFMIWMRNFNTQAIKVWANEPSFDCAILGHSLQAHKFATPWQFYNERSYRTIKDIGKEIVGIDYANLEIKNATKHHALEDAIYQAKVISYTYKLLQEKML